MAERPQKKRRWRDQTDTTVFVNQLPYDATEAQIKGFILQSPSLSSDSIKNIRMVHFKPKDDDKKKGGFKGIAFIELDSEESREAALALNGSDFLGRRQVNVQLPKDQEALKKKAQDKKKQRIDSVKPGKIMDRDLTELIANAAKPRRSKKGEKGRAPAKDISLWTDFNQESLNLMKSLPLVELKRMLSDFYKSTVEGDPNQFFMKLVANKPKITVKKKKRYIPPVGNKQESPKRKVK